MPWERRSEDYSEHEKKSLRTRVHSVLQEERRNPDDVAYIDTLIRSWKDLSRHPQRLRDGIIHVANALERHPNLINSLNMFVPKKSGLGVFCSTERPVKYVTIHGHDRADIVHLSTSKPPGGLPTSGASLLSISDQDWSKLINYCAGDLSYGGSVMEVLQWEYDHQSHLSEERYLAGKRLVQVSKRLDALPQSMYIDADLVIKDKRPSATGSGGDILLGQACGKLLCVKVLRFANNVSYKDPRARKNLLREVIPWSRADHKNIMPFCGISLSAQTGKVALISPWCEDGNIDQFLNHNSSVDRLRCVRDIVEGLRYLHTFNPPIYHHDLKPENILVNKGVCLISDFGLASIISINRSQRVETSTNREEGSLRYKAPELLVDSSGFPLNHSASDIWALGCVIYRICSNQVPYSHLNVEGRIIMEIHSGKKPGDCFSNYYSPALWKFVRSCWKRDPGLRPRLQDTDLGTFSTRTGYNHTQAHA